jgi:uncharacterized membrane protein
VTQVHYHSPIPPPEFLEAWEKHVPGAGERLLSMAELTIRSRIEAEAIALRAAVRAELIGVALGFVFVMSGLALGAALIYSGRSTLGLVGLIAPLGAVTAVFIHARSRQLREREHKVRRVESGG